MAKVTQYYGERPAPLVIEASPDEPLQVWRSQRARLRGWLEALPADAWDQPTRCAEWNVAQLVQHLVSGAQFLGYTLHEANRGIATELLRDFDTHETVQAAASLLESMDREQLLAALAEMDANVEREAERAGDADWRAVAEAPPGHLPAHLSLNHFVFDSWVHEYDLLLPQGYQPELEPLEAAVTLRYLLGLAAAVTGELAQDLEVHATDIDVRLLACGDGERVTVRDVAERGSSPGASGTVQDLVDRMTGREAGPVDGDPAALAALDRMAAVLTT